MAPSTYGDDATIGGGDISITAGDDTAATLILSADSSTDANDDWKFNAADGGVFTIGNDVASAGTFVSQITLTPHATATSSTTAISGNLTVGGTATCNAGVIVDNITIDGTEIDLSSGDLTVDVAGNVEINADGGTITFKDDAATLATVTSAGVSQAALATLATSVTVSAKNTANETVYPVFVDGATGTQGAETDTGLTYNPMSGMLTANALAGTLATAAQTAVTSLGTLTALQVDYINANGSTLTITDSSDTGDTFSIATTTHGATTIATVDDDATAAHLTLDVDGNITLDADGGTVTFADAGSSLGTITSAGWTGDVVGDVTGDVTGNADTATLATSVTVSANNSADETVYPVFVDAATGTQGAETDTGLTYNPSTGLLTATKLAGAFNGTVGATTAAAGAFTTLSATGDLTLSTGGDGAITFSAASTIKMADNSAASLVIEAADDVAYMTFNTLDAGPGLVQFDKAALVTGTNKIQFDDNSNWDQYIGSIGSDTTQLSSPNLMLNASAGAMALSGSSSFTATFGAAQFTSANASEPVFLVKNTNADANGAMFVLNKTSASPADNDILGSVVWQGANDADPAEQTSYSMIRGLSTDVADASEDGSLSFWTMVGGTLTQVMDLSKNSAGNLTVARSAMIAGGDLHFQTDDKGIKFGEHGDVTLTHVHNTGLLLTDDSGTGTTKLQFGDSGTFINQPADGTLGIDADTIVDVTAPTVNLEAAAINLGEDDTSDVTLTFKGTNNDGVLAWDESADEFIFSDGIKISKPAQALDMATAAGGSGGTGQDYTGNLNLTAAGTSARRGTVTITLAEAMASSGASAAPTVYVMSSLVKATDVIVATPGIPSIGGEQTNMQMKNLICTVNNVYDGGFNIVILNSFSGGSWGSDDDFIAVNWVAL